MVAAIVDPAGQQPPAVIVAKLRGPAGGRAVGSDKTLHARETLAACGRKRLAGGLAVLLSILEAAQPLSQPLRTAIEAAGLEFSRSIMLLPHWLAIEMGWDSGAES